MKTFIAPFAGGMIAALGLAAPALAGGMTETVAPAPIVVPAPVPVAAGNDWTGAYGGVAVGQGEVEADGFEFDDMTGTTYSVFGGYMYDMGSLVLGGELAYTGGDITDDASGIEFDSILSVKGRLGYDAGRVLPYVTAGFAQGATTGAFEDEDNGYLYGLGMDYAVSDNLMVGAELLQYEFEDFADTGVDGSFRDIALRVSYRF